MPALDFPNSPVEGTTFTSGDKSWKYTNGAWILVPFSDPFLINIDGGSPSSVYGPIGAIDGGSP